MSRSQRSDQGHQARKKLEESSLRSSARGRPSLAQPTCTSSLQGQFSRYKEFISIMRLLERRRTIQSLQRPAVTLHSQPPGRPTACITTAGRERACCQNCHIRRHPRTLLGARSQHTLHTGDPSLPRLHAAWQTGNSRRGNPVPSPACPSASPCPEEAPPGRAAHDSASDTCHAPRQHYTRLLSPSLLSP
jgi:hypothetical protein